MAKSNHFVICGAGRFGLRASNFLSQDSKTHGTIIDHDQKKLRRIINPSLFKIQADVIDFLIQKYALLPPDTLFIPAVPLHLAFEWLMNIIQEDYVIRRLDIPPDISSGLPHPWQGSRHELICSYADFICPEDCPEPEDICTITGRPREKPLFNVISGLDSAGFQTGVVRSRQIGPGIGGYSFRELLALKERVEQERKGKWLIGTACRCHGIVSAFEFLKKM